MEQVKKLLGETIVKLKLLVGVVIAGLLVGVAAWRKHVQEERAKQDVEKEYIYQQFIKKEIKAKQNEKVQENQ